MKKIYLLLLLGCTLGGYAQIGGTSVFQFLDLPNSARVGALGGHNISLYDKDLNMANYNPGLLDERMHNNLALTYTNYVSDINYFYASYAYHYQDIGTFAASVNYIDYGNFVRADHIGNITGEFSGSDYNIKLYYSRELTKDSSLTAGVDLNTIVSHLDVYSSVGMALDLGLNYHKRGSNFSASAVLTNVGYQLKTYIAGNHESLPIDMQLGVTYKTPHAPFRVSLGMNNLFRWNMRYESDVDTEQVIMDDQEGEKELSFSTKLANAGDEALRHLVLGVEIMPTDNFFVAVGYNHQRRQELSLSKAPGVVGFSFGAGIKISKFMISYGYGKYHIAGSSHHISISTDLNEFKKKI